MARDLETLSDVLWKAFEKSAQRDVELYDDTRHSDRHNH